MATKKIIKKTPTKTIPTKKAPAKKTPTPSNVKSSVEAKAKTFAKNIEKEAKVIKNEGKVIGSKIGTRRERANTEEKIFMVLWVIAMIRGLSILFKNGRRLFVSMLLIIMGILLVTGFFNKKSNK